MDKTLDSNLMGLLSLGSIPGRNQMLFDHLMVRYRASVVGVFKSRNDGLVLGSMAPVMNSFLDHAKFVHLCFVHFQVLLLLSVLAF